MSDGQVLASAGEEAGVRCLLDRPPLTCDKDAPIAVCVRDAITNVTGCRPNENRCRLLDGRRALCGRRHTHG
jgi:hypothetical protein